MGPWNKIKSVAGAFVAPLKPVFGWLGDRPWWQLIGLVAAGIVVAVVGYGVLAAGLVVSAPAAVIISGGAGLVGGGTTAVVAGTTLGDKAIDGIKDRIRDEDVEESETDEGATPWEDADPQVSPATDDDEPVDWKEEPAPPLERPSARRGLSGALPGF